MGNFRIILTTFIMLSSALLFTGCDETIDSVRYNARGFTIYDGLDPVIYGELVERSVWRDGALIGTETSLALTNVSGFAIEMDLSLNTTIWAERIDITYFNDGDTIDLGLISTDSRAFNAPITSVWNHLNYWWFSLKSAA